MENRPNQERENRPYRDHGNRPQRDRDTRRPPQQNLSYDTGGDADLDLDFRDVNTNDPGIKQRVKDIENEVHSILKEINREDLQLKNTIEDYPVDKNSKITLNFKNGRDASGILKEIDKYRIIIEDDGKLKYYYKHAISNYIVAG